MTDTKQAPLEPVCTITSNDDDSVTVTAGNYTIRIDALDWRKANEMAHCVSELLHTREQIRASKAKLESVIGLLDVLHEQLGEIREEASRD